jgi:hypothetical protein
LNCIDVLQGIEKTQGCCNTHSLLFFIAMPAMGGSIFTRSGIAANGKLSRDILSFSFLNRQTVQQKKWFGKSFSTIFCKKIQFSYA